MKSFLEWKLSSMSARDKEKYYWWKKDKNYYSQHKIKALEKRKNGYAYSVLLDKIKCESTPYKGILRFSETRAFTIEELSAVVDMPIKLVKSVLEALEELELIKKHDDGAIEIIDFCKCVGSETGQTVRKRKATEGGNSEVNFTAPLPQNDQKNTLEIRVRDKNIDIKNKIIYLISSSSITYSSMKLDKEYEETKEMMIKAAQVTNKIPTKERLEDLMKEIIFEEKTIYDKQAYLIQCFKNEDNYEHL